jgi:hypothetical protein
MGEEKEALEGLDLKEDVPLVPIAGGTLPVVAQMISPVAVQALAQQAPEKLLEFIESYDERQFQYCSLKENNRHQERKHEESTKRIGIYFLGLAFAATLVYAGVTGDKALPDKLITIALGAGGGAGLVVASSRSAKNKEEE